MGLKRIRLIRKHTKLAIFSTFWIFPEQQDFFVGSVAYRFQLTGFQEESDHVELLCGTFFIKYSVSYFLEVVTTTTRLALSRQIISGTGKKLKFSHDQQTTCSVALTTSGHPVLFFWGGLFLVF